MDYIARVRSAIDFIEQHLFDDISLQTVAGHVSVSAYHFHRLFSAITGESVADYIRKRRLTVAADELAATDRAILDIALECRFESQESFTRAFKKMFGLTPGLYRKEGAGASFVTKPETTLDMILHLQGGISMEPRFETRDSEKVVGLAGSFVPNSFDKIAALWDRFNPRRNEILHTKPTYDLGVCGARIPGFKLSDEEFIYIACAPVTEVENIPDGMVSYTVPACRYAVFTHKGHISKITHTVNYIWGTWLPKSSYKQAMSPDFELYDARFDPESGTGEVDIYLPVA